ncbi:MAG: ArsR family transcriptional regulator, lead/cadmium/zinc/bismuth-responsive transcriptional [Pseudonocardiales bacterium]|nr:transcriptional regulator [Pseudonocardia sp.]MDT7558658.1 ArsR family transcriptional regulator, lead/cadmium/zinc/bismuth-responsive transcriptional [Pseudonocardiales bacterium]MDT7564864.1 ArsR family transcriptional regulator, lead/cadmium/zinc/bismuth-responsive transcriptional [Pseudonocardiales bacterium]MDT7590334.1 ArsR family transcriptional regulator, lead/cadmium/zinc/bismuth-responsive transcriptional [Pseudonocardiales bacterium]MDT7608839.1 ArsR family transcriptional regulat
MHLLDPNDPHTIVDGDRVCEAIAHLPDPDALHDWVTRFALLADQTRLALLLCIQHAGEICVSDLAAATGVKDSTVSQALRLLRAHGVVATRRDGRTIHYHLTDDAIPALLGQLPTGPADAVHGHSKEHRPA